MSERRRQVVFVAFEGIQLLDLVGPAEVLDAATRLLGDDAGYQVAVASPGGRPVRGVSGLRLSADLALSHVRARGLDTLIVPGG
jgi:transcriptional regulator GlxA family with amidase domain